VDNRGWRLESFVDSLVVELDKTRETLAVKSINRPLTYGVKDIALELQIFPTYDGDIVEFRTAQAGQAGASKLSIQLASITDQQVRATSKAPPRKDSVGLDSAGVDPATKKELRRLGVTSVDDLEQIEKRDVDLGKVSPEAAVDYKNLANLIRKSRRSAPQVHAVSLQRSSTGEPLLRLRGENLAVSASHTPVAVLNGRLRDVVEQGAGSLTIALDETESLAPENELIVTLDPYCLVRVNVRTPRSH
jgi:hypothetical protein